MFLQCFVSNLQRKKRTKLKRLAVHITCADGLASVPDNVERALVSAFCQIVHNLMAVGGWISLSSDSTGTRETALFQLPWILPCYFSFDGKDYSQVQHADWDGGGLPVPASTPINLALPYFECDPSKRPSGTLVNFQSLTSSGPSSFKSSSTRSGTFDSNPFQKK